MPGMKKEKKAKGCVFAMLKVLVIAIGLYLLLRERFDVIIRMVNPWWWAASVLAVVLLFFLIARYINRH